MSKIMHWRWLLLVATLMMVLCCCAGVAAEEPTGAVVITGPTEITKPGLYILEDSFFGSYEGTFITISADDVVLDGHGHTIMTNGTGPDRIGVLVEGNVKNVRVASMYLNSFDEGCVVKGESEVELWGLNPLNCEDAGIKLEGAMGCIVDSCTITDNKGPGLEIIDGAANRIFNNKFVNAENVSISGPNTHIWNQTKTEEQNIIGGPYLGGNFWGSPDGDGWSETHPDTDGDGFCDEAFYLDNNDVDLLPLSLEQPPIPDLEAKFKADVTSGEAPLTVKFTDASTGGPKTWEWDFGDGNTSAKQNPTHVYATPGTYDVTLTVSDGKVTKTETRTGYIEVTEPASAPPKAEFEADVTAGETPLTVQFTDTSAGDPTKWSWDFGDGANSTEQNPTHYYQTPGTYNVTLTVSDGDDDDTLVIPDYIEVTPSTKPLAANFTTNETAGAAPLIVNFIDLSTGNPTGWSWDFGDGGTSDLQNPIYTYEEAGAYNVTLTVSNGTANRTLTMEDYVTVGEPVPKPIAANFTADATSGKTPFTVSFKDTSTGNVTSWKWSFGEGMGTSSLQNPTYVYKKAGTYTVSLIVSDGETNDTLTRKSYITVTNPSTRRYSSGGGGGGPSSNVGVRSGLDSGDSAVFTFRGIGVSEVKITAAERIDGIRLSLKKASDEPEGLDTEVYQYLLADMTYAEEDDIDEIVFSFDVLKSWLKDHDADEGDIVLWRYHDETWQPLRTELVKETNTRVYYQAVSPGFSYFAIAVGEGMTIIPEGALSESSADAEETPVQEEPTETIVTGTTPSEPSENATTTETTAQPTSLGVMGVLLALVAVGLVVLFVRRR